VIYLVTKHKFILTTENSFTFGYQTEDTVYTTLDYTEKQQVLRQFTAAMVYS